MVFQGKDLKIFSGNSNPSLAPEIARHLGTEVGRAEVGVFSDGEIHVTINETVRGCDVFVIQSTCSPVNNNLMELLIMIDAFKRASAARVTAVVPYFGYARQDRKAKARDPISAKLAADIITAAGADRLLTIDLHAPQIQGFFNIPVDHLLGVPKLVPYFLKKYGGKMDGVAVVSPDLGSVNRARQFAERVGASLAIIDKRRQRANVSEVMNIIGDVKDKDVILVDDLIDTAGTICNAAEAVIERGGAKSVTACATHGVLSGPALQRINASPIEEVVLLDTIPPVPGAGAKFKYLGVSKVLSEAIHRIFTNQPVSPMFEFQ